MEETISIQKIFEALKKRIILIFVVTAGALILGALITFFIMTPKYEASTQILINQSQAENEELTSTDLQSSRELMSTYNVIMTSPAILDSVIENTDFDGSVNDLRSSVTVEAEEESQVATVTIENSNPQTAVSLVNTLARTFEQEIPNIMDVDNVSVLSEAQLADSESPVSPQPLLNLAIAILIGLSIGIGLAILFEFLDKSIKDEKDVEEHLTLPILGVVPMMEEQERKISKSEPNLNNRVQAKSRSGERKTF